MADYPAMPCKPGEVRVGKYKCVRPGAPKRTLEQLAREDNLILFDDSIGAGPNFAFGGAPMGGGNTWGALPARWDAGPVLDTGAKLACGAIPNAALRQICLAGSGPVVDYLNRKLGGGGGTPASTPGPTTYMDQGGGGGCPPGKIKVGKYCVAPGDAFPGGDPLVTGAGGVPAGAGPIPGGQTPTAYPTTVLRCPKRYILGMDNICYPKPFLPRQLRKWQPAPRPLLTAMDAKIVARARGVQKRIRKAAGKYAPAPRKCSTRKKK